MMILNLYNNQEENYILFQIIYKFNLLINE